MLKKIVPLLVVALTVSGLSLYASARNDTAVHGFVRAADRSCFVEFGGAGTMVNTCGTTKNIVIPASQDHQCTTGGHFRVNAQGNGAGNPVCCRVVSGFNDQSAYFGALKCNSSPTAVEQFDVEHGKPGADRWIFNCSVAPGARLLGVDWTPAGDCD